MPLVELSNPTVLDLKAALAQLSAEMDRRQEGSGVAWM